MNLSPFPEPVEALHFIRDVHEKKGRPFDRLRERELDTPINLDFVIASEARQSSLWCRWIAALRSQ